MIQKRFLFWFVIILNSFQGIINAQQLHKLKTYELIERQFIPTEHILGLEKLQIQDFQGRIKPTHTLALDLLRKIHGKNSFKYTNQEGSITKLDATQVFLGMQFKPDSWQLLPLII